MVFRVQHLSGLHVDLFNLVYFVRVTVFVVQLSQMLHGTTEATLKPIRFQFITRNVINNAFVAQVHWEAVLNLWPVSSKASVAKYVVCAWNSARSVGGPAEPTSRTFQTFQLRLKVKRYSSPEQVISVLRGITSHVGSHSVTCHPTQVNSPRLTPARQTGTRFTYSGEMEA